MRSGRRDAVADQALVVAAQRGDRRALDDLVAAYMPLVYNIVGRALDGHSDVDDVVQETLVRAVEGLRDLRDPAAFRPWLAAIAIRCVRDRWRAQQARPVAPLGSGGDPDAPLDAVDPGADFVDLTILRLELSGQRRETVLATRWLDPDDRELLTLWWLEAAGEMSRAELVETLGLTAGHTSVRVQRMKQQLETARTVVRALSAVPRCAELAELTRRWNGRPTSVWRKQFARHTRECVDCGVQAQGLVPAERLLMGLGLVPVPVHLAAKWPALGSGTSPAGAAVGRARHASGEARRAGWVAGHASAKVVAVAAGVVLTAGAAAAYAASGSAPQRHAAAAAPTTISALTTHASQSTTTSPPQPSSSTSTTSAPPPGAGTTVPGLTTASLDLPSALSYLESGYNEMPEWTRIDTETAPDGTVQIAWPAADGVHVTPLTATLQRRGPDVVVPGAREVGGLVAHNDGFALLTRVPDSNKWGDTAAALVRYRDGARVFLRKLTGSASNDTSPVLDSQLKWDGSRYGAYFVVHGAGGFADGHYGDKLSYVNGNGSVLSGGWDWGCSHNEGIALYPETSGAFTSLCFDDWRSGLFVSTGIGAPDEAPVVQREQCWAGYCGGAFPDNAGAIVKSPSGRYATAFASRGSASAGKNPADSSGRGWSVTPRTATHQVAVAFLKNGSTPDGSPVLLTNEPVTDHVNVRIAPFGTGRLLVSWEDVLNASCNAGTCTGKFGGTHIRVIDWSGKTLAADQVVDARIAGDIAVLPDGSLVWAYVRATPDDSGPLSGSPTSSTLTIARLK